jgi:hypothetical protein
MGCVAPGGKCLRHLKIKQTHMKIISNLLEYWKKYFGPLIKGITLFKFSNKD